MSLFRVWQMFVRQHYLRKTDTQRPTADGGTESIVSYTMGARSHLEVRYIGPWFCLVIS